MTANDQHGARQKMGKIHTSHGVIFNSTNSHQVSRVKIAPFACAQSRSNPKTQAKSTSWGK
jgi:hypothetical protein